MHVRSSLGSGLAHGVGPMSPSESFEPRLDSQSLDAGRHRAFLRSTKRFRRRILVHRGRLNEGDVRVKSSGSLVPVRVPGDPRNQGSRWLRIAPRSPRIISTPSFTDKTILHTPQTRCRFQTPSISGSSYLENAMLVSSSSP